MSDDLQPDEFCHEQEQDFTAYPLCRWCNEPQRADEMRNYCWRRELREARAALDAMQRKANCTHVYNSHIIPFDCMSTCTR